MKTCDYHITMEVYAKRSQSNRSLVQHTTHFTQSYDEICQWHDLFEAYAVPTTNVGMNKSDKAPYDIIITIADGKDDRSTIFTGQNANDLDKWRQFLAKIAPEADERRL